jgi:hypothetical protein
LYSNVLGYSPIPDDSKLLIDRTIVYSQENGQYGDVYIDPSKGVYKTFTNGWSAGVQFANGPISQINGKTTNLNGATITFEPALYNINVTNNGTTTIVSGPGRIVDQNARPNVYGTIYNKHRMWAMYVAIGLLITGVLFTILLKPKETSIRNSESIVTKNKLSNKENESKERTRSTTI